MPVLTDEDFADKMVAMPPPRRGSRAAEVLKTEGIDIRPALTYLAEADRGSRQMTEEITRFAHHAKALLDGPMRIESIALLIQDNLPVQKGGAGGSRKFPIDQIIAVLQAAARLTDHLKPEHRDPSKR